MYSPPPKSYADVLIPSITEYDLIWRQDLNGSDEVKMKSLRWAVIQNDQCPDRGGKFRHRDRHGQRDDTENTQEHSHATGVMQL